MTTDIARPSPTSPHRPHVDLFLISFVILFFQLACIRWFGSTVVFMTFFTNVVLMACFLGMSVGCLTASRKQNFVDALIPVALLTLGLSYTVLGIYTRFGHRIAIDVGGQGSPQEIFFGTEYLANDPSRFFIPIEAVAVGTPPLALASGRSRAIPCRRSSAAPARGPLTAGSTLW